MGSVGCWHQIVIFLWAITSRMVSGSKIDYQKWRSIDKWAIAKFTFRAKMRENNNAIIFSDKLMSIWNLIDYLIDLM